VDRTEAAEDRKKDDGRDPFERFVEAANQVVSRGPFFLVILFALIVWAVSYPFWSSTTKWELALHTGSAILSLFLLVLLENAGRRSQEAIQEKLNVVAEALSDLMTSRAADDPELEESVEKLREAIGLEERH
jgi:low affinity Fe/Cu permease